MERSADRLAEQRAQGIAALYALQEGGRPPLVPHGTLPKRRREGASEGESKARQRMHDLLRPDRVASAAEESVLRAAGIPLKDRPGGGFSIAPDIPRESELGGFQALVDRAMGIGRLYGLVPGSTPVVDAGTLPAWRREGASAEENKARHRMHDLLQPDRVASAAEERELRAAGIPLKDRPDGGFHIDPAIPRESGRGGSQAHVNIVTGIGRLYGLVPGSTPVVDAGTLPKRRREGASEEESKTRQRMHDLLRPDRVASAAEESVLRAAGIPLKERDGGGFHIDPAIPRESELGGFQALVDRAMGIGRLYGLVPGSTPVVDAGTLPAWRREGASAEENKARHRMHDLLQPDRVASAAEERELRAAGIPLKDRPDGGFHIDPAIPRESGRGGSQAHVNIVTGIGRLYGLVPGSTPVVDAGTLPKQRREGASEEESKARRRMHNLLNPRSVASAAEESVLRAAKIPLKDRPDGGFHIDPAIPRESGKRASRVSGLTKGDPSVSQVPTAARAAADAMPSPEDSQNAALTYSWQYGRPSVQEIYDDPDRLHDLHPQNPVSVSYHAQQNMGGPDQPAYPGVASQLLPTAQNIDQPHWTTHSHTYNPYVSSPYTPHPQGPAYTTNGQDYQMPAAPPGSSARTHSRTRGSSTSSR
ncbi:hypothetical protein PV387_41310 [Streptomyces sp. ME02-6987-2C]|uniref:hypothetical protein n=3 Tax=unclassified Streptomyces TaxID=2593676 RepID=UPI0029B0FC63|nr:hypothetical protein [Streptomyces sp. ME02-6987-2C]MDX3372338.1 hypothetical protein [Streptomyces sp. ME02-6987-2C]